MGHYVHIHVCFSCDQNEGVATLAEKHSEAFPGPDFDDTTRYVNWFLVDLAGRRGVNLGPKGGLSMWGMTGNYTNVEGFCEALRPFWGDLLSGEVDGGPCEFEHVIVFEEQEQKEQATAYEISRDEESGAVTIKKHLLPFAWMQM